MFELFPKNFGKCIIQEQIWANLKCRNCGGEMKTTQNNEFESVKVCQRCGRKVLLVKKFRKEAKEMYDDKEKEHLGREAECNKAINKLVKLKQKYTELKEDRDYIKSLLDTEFEERIKLKKKNKQLYKSNLHLRQALELEKNKVNELRESNKRLKYDRNNCREQQVRQANKIHWLLKENKQLRGPTEE